MTLLEVDDTEVMTRHVLLPDETGGLELLVTMLNHKQDATSEHQIVKPRPQTTAKPAVRRSPSRLGRALARAKASIAKAVATVREATAWLFSGVPNPQLITRYRNRFFGYKGKHHTASAWYGRQRSTAAAVVITRERRMRAQQTSRTKEGVLSSYYELPEYWVSHMASFIEAFRDHESALRSPQREHYVCS
jgi:predicted ATP-dependent protease